MIGAARIIFVSIRTGQFIISSVVSAVQNCFLVRVRKTFVILHAFIKEIHERSRDRSVLEFATSQDRSQTTQCCRFDGAFDRVLPRLFAYWRRRHRAAASRQETGAEVARADLADQAPHQAVGNERARKVADARKAALPRRLHQAPRLRERARLQRRQRGALQRIGDDECGDSVGDGGVDRQSQGGDGGGAMVTAPVPVQAVPVVTRVLVRRFRPSKPLFSLALAPALFSQVRAVSRPRVSNVKVWLATLAPVPARIDCTRPMLGSRPGWW